MGANREVEFMGYKVEVSIQNGVEARIKKFAVRTLKSLA